MYVDVSYIFSLDRLFVYCWFALFVYIYVCIIHTVGGFMNEAKSMTAGTAVLYGICPGKTAVR